MLKRFPAYRWGSRQEFRKVRSGKYKAWKEYLQMKDCFFQIMQTLSGTVEEN